MTATWAKQGIVSLTQPLLVDSGRSHKRNENPTEPGRSSQPEQDKHDVHLRKGLPDASTETI